MDLAPETETSMKERKVDIHASLHGVSIDELHNHAMAVEVDRFRHRKFAIVESLEEEEEARVHVSLMY